MIGLVEGAKRQKTPNEIALHVLLAGMTIIFLIACVTLVPFGLYSGLRFSVGGDRGAARVPDPHHHRRPDLRHRHRGHGPADPPQRDPHERPRRGGRGRRGHDPARQDGHHHPRQPHGQRVPPRARRAGSRSWPTRPSSRAWPTRRPRAARSWCWPRSSTACAAASSRSPDAHFVPFSAQTRMSGCDLDGRVIRKGAADAIARHVAVPGRQGAHGGGAGGRSTIAKSGGTPLAVSDGTRVLGRRAPEGHRQGRAQGALRAVPRHGPAHGDDHRRQPADRGRHRRRGRRRRLPGRGHAGDEARG